MSTKVASLFAEIGADTRGLERGLQKTQGGLKGAERQMKDFGGGASNAFKVAGAAVSGFLALDATRRLIEFANASIQVASDVEEMENKFSVVFGTTAPAVTAALDKMGDAVNRSTFDLMEMASTVQDTFVPLGFAREQAASLSVELTQLAVDVASFNNAQDADVMRDFQSALVGNTETVRKYGIVITEANTKAKAYAMGISEAGDALTEQEKVQARLQLILEGTADAQGDAARTADSYANVSKGLEAALFDLQEVIGSKLTPKMSWFKREAIDVINTLKLLASWSDEVTEAQEEQAVNLVLNSKTYDEYLENLFRLEGGLKGWSDAEIQALLTHEDMAATLQRFIVQTGAATEEMWLAEQAVLRFAEGTEYAAYWAEQYAYRAGEVQDSVRGVTSSFDDVGEGAEKAGEKVGVAGLAFGAVSIDLDKVKQNAAGAKESWDSLYGSLNRDIPSMLDEFEKDMIFIQNNGPQLQTAIQNIMDAVAADPSMIGDERLDSIIASAKTEAADLAALTGEMTFDEAAQSLADSLGIELEAAKELMDGMVSTVGLSIPVAFSDAGQAGSIFYSIVDEGIEPLSETEQLTRQIADNVKKAAGEHTIKYNIEYDGDWKDPDAGEAKIGGRDKPEMRQGGGPVVRGTPYIIGERGPELFVPDQSGQVVPNNELAQLGGGGASFSFSGDIVVYTNATDGEGIGQDILDALGREVRLASNAGAAFIGR